MQEADIHSPPHTQERHWHNHMNLQINEKKIPGTVLDRASMGNVTGLEFLGKIFYISDGIMLTQNREIAGIDGTAKVEPGVVNAIPAGSSYRGTTDSSGVSSPLERI